MRQARRLPIGEGAYEHAVHHAEYRRVGPDTEGQRQNRHHGEERLGLQRAERIVNI